MLHTCNAEFKNCTSCCRDFVCSIFSFSLSISSCSLSNRSWCGAPSCSLWYLQFDKYNRNVSKNHSLFIRISIILINMINKLLKSKKKLRNLNNITFLCCHLSWRCCTRCPHHFGIFAPQNCDDVGRQSCEKWTHADWLVTLLNRDAPFHLDPIQHLRHLHRWHCRHQNLLFQALCTTLRITTMRLRCSAGHARMRWEFAGYVLCADMLDAD